MNTNLLVYFIVYKGTLDPAQFEELYKRRLKAILSLLFWCTMLQVPIS